MSSKRSVQKAGFTLPEFLVAMTLFAVVATFAISSIISVGNLARAAAAKRAVIDNVNFALETISRKVKVGRTYSCTSGAAAGFTSQPCPSGGGDHLAFAASDGTTHVEYRYSVVSGKGVLETGSCQLSGGTCTITSYVPLTAPEVNLAKLKFYSSGVTIGDQLQPRIVAVLEGQVQAANSARGTPDTTTFTIQTTLSQRVLEN